MSLQSAAGKVNTAGSSAWRNSGHTVLTVNPFFIYFAVVPNVVISSVTDLLWLLFGLSGFPNTWWFHSWSSAVSFRSVCPIQTHVLFFDNFPDAVLVRHPRELFVCDFVLPFNFENISETIGYTCFYFVFGNVLVILLMWWKCNLE